jgi:hypothetical protein
MSLVRIVQLLGLIMAVLAFATMPSPAEAACACSRVGQSNGYYAAPSAYGSYGYGYDATYSPQVQPQVQTVQPKAAKSKKKASKSKPVAQ